LLSLLIPISGVFSYTSAYQIGNTNSVTSIIHSGTEIGATMAKKIIVSDSSHLVVWLYFAGSFFFLSRFVISVTQTFLIIRKGVLLDEKYPKVILTDREHTPFSFFPYIVISRKTKDSDDYKEIIAHENAHIQQRHTFDLLLCEFIIAFLWFDPFIWLLKRSIVLNHEYLADNFSIQNASSAKDYQYKLLNIRKDLINVPFAHNFSSLIKNRIVMINKKPTSRFAALKGILIIPIAAILFMMFSFRQGSVQENQEHLFSKSSETEILRFLASNTGYPQEARNASDTGIIFVFIKIAKGGVVKECKTFTDRKEVKVPLLPEMVIVGYKPASVRTITETEHKELKTECLRVVKTLGDAKIPEWKDKDAEFAVEFKFTLK
jgi:hypothetical protein